VNAILIAKGADMIREVAFLCEGVDPSAVLTVFPGKRPAHFLRRALARARGAGFIPPRVLSMDELVHSVFDERTGGMCPVIEDIDAVAILHEIQIASPNPIGGSAFMSLDSFFSLGLKVFEDLEELLIEGVESRRVAEVQPLIEAEVPLASRRRLVELERFYAEFYPAVERLGLSTRSSRFRAVCDAIEEKDLERFARIILAGFFSLSGAEAALLRRIGPWQKTRLVFQDGPGMREKLERLGISHPEMSGEEPPRGEVRFYSSPDTHGQVFALAALLREPGEDAAVVLPAPETLFPLIRHCLSRFPEESYNVSLGYPLDRTPLYGLFADLMKLIASMDGDRVYVPDYLTFMLHPYTKNIRFRGSAEATRVLVHSIEERLASSRTRVFTSLEEIEADGELFRAALAAVPQEEGETTAEELASHLRLIHDLTIRRFRSFLTVREFARRCVELIAWVHESSTAPAHPFFSQFSEEFIQSLQAISKSLMADKSFSDTAGYFIVFKRYLRTRYHPFPGTPLRGLQVLGALETRCLRFARVYVLDANEGALPAASAQDTLLPFAVRRSLGLQTYQDREEAACYHFEQLARGAAQLSLFSVDSGERQRSRLVEKLLWEREKEAGGMDKGNLVRPIHYRVSLENRAPEPIAKTPEVIAWLREREISATALDSYLRCPLSFYYKTVLGLGERAQPSGEFEQADIGLFVHDALYRYFAPRVGRTLTAADADPKAMQGIVGELFRKRYGDEESGAARLLCRQLRAHLKDFVAGYLSQLVSRHRVELKRLEHRGSATWNGFHLAGRIDAMEERDGQVWIIDYKTSANPLWYRIRFDRLDLGDRESWSAAIPTLQLPFYLTLEPEASSAMFLLLGKSFLDGGIEARLFSDQEESRRELPRLREVILGLLTEMVSLDTPFTPALDRKRTCPSCAFTTLCGTKWLA
jgi:ATP-dependent helicase/nuclease subunit B